MIIQPYLFFGGRCEEAIAFYTQAIGAEATMVMRFRDCPDPPPPGTFPPGSEDKIMHAALKIGETLVMASDGDCAGAQGFDGFALSITAANKAEAERLFAALAEGGQIRMPMGPTFYSPAFGMLADRFGVGWMVIVMP
jgi:PhnB protein